MRQGQQHRRGRGRHNQNNNHHQRKGQNPLTRSFESNGPDVKVRGTPAHIAEKYISLARDAQSSGDPVLAENYLQHAEHYNRIILAYREQHMQQSGEGMNGGSHPRMRPMEGSEGDEFSEEESGGVDDIGSSEQPTVTRFPHEMQQMPAAGEQQPRHGEMGHRPRQEQHGRYRDRYERHERRGEPSDRGDRPYDRQERHQDRHERHDRQDRFSDRQQRFSDRRDRHPNQDRPPEQAFPYERGSEVRDATPPPAPPAPSRERAPEEPPVAEPVAAPRSEPSSAAPRRRERFGGLGNDQPEFLRRPVRRTRRDPDAGPAPEASVTDEPPRE